MGEIGTERREVEFEPLEDQPATRPGRTEPARPAQPAPPAPDPART